MIIASSQIQMHSSHTLLEYQRQHEALTVWRDGPQGRQTVHMEASQERLHLSHGQQQLQLQSSAPLGALPPVDEEDLPARMRGLLPANPAAINAAAPNSAVARVHGPDEEASAEDTLDLKTAMLKLFVERLTGRKIELFDPSELKIGAQQGQEGLADPARHAEQPERPEGWGMHYESSHTLIEMERSHFSAAGVVRTADGREIELELDLFISRDFIQHSQVRIEAGDARLKDPLVINFNGHSAELTQSRYSFDLDANGQLDEIHFVGPNSGFLALDRNGDGVINDGSELFGALSGNGFAELARYDEDGNGWIDANDSVFSRLLLWSKDADGTDRLESLEARGIGAIYLGHAATPFSLKDNQNQLQGQIRATGIYLSEHGQVGSVQQLDLVV